MNAESEKTCFVIAPIGEPESDTRRRSDQILRYIIRPAVEECGYIATRADEIDEPGIITNQVIQRVVDGDLVVADLTGLNPNVFYELAIRHAIRKPFIQVVNEGESIPFDVSVTRTIFVNHQDLDNVARAKSAIVDQIRSLEADSSRLETPISVSLDLQRLRQSGNPEQRSLADLLSEVSSIRSVLSAIEEKASIGRSEQLYAHEIMRFEERLMDRLEHTTLAGRTSGRRRRISPDRIIDLIRSASETTTELIALPIVLSFLREDMPWIYEVGMETYRYTTAGTTRQAKESAMALLRLTEISRDVIPQTPEFRGLMNELEGILNYVLSARE